ncbi:apolipoprotein D and lipocalin family protein [Gemmobacter aquatilis]|uniref:Apolipoprotein D and lipocalin family protein n=1 Tax=Gemmobacter aquatilis TaxID=933059 RepID=A0A1H8HY00_9RHOB|nr:lipocalin family protein [Gemmobacter aquatilis]SEN60756.1 apolipoprotein D and lipocalin family protein [Gemmobacter aquatilis]
MYRLIVLALVLLAACAKEPDRRTSFRDRSAQIYSNAVLDPARLTGGWQQVAAFAAEPGGCASGQVQFGAPSAGTIPLEAALCLNGAPQRFRGHAQLAGPGRMVPMGAEANGIGQPWWVLWADVDDRTLVIGTPTGEMGFILNRGGALPPDRLRAARAILDWNGYDLSRLQLF